MGEPSCGCSIVDDERVPEGIIWCGLHRNAKDLLAAFETLAWAYHNVMTPPDPDQKDETAAEVPVELTKCDAAICTRNRELIRLATMEGPSQIEPRGIDRQDPVRDVSDGDTGTGQDRPEEEPHWEVSVEPEGLDDLPIE